MYAVPIDHYLLQEEGAKKLTEELYPALFPSVQRILLNFNKDCIKVAWRNIIKRPFYSIVNIAGLAIGVAFTFLIGAYVWSELQVNKNLKNADNQYILQSKWKDPNMGYEIATIGKLPKALKEQYPNLVANYYRWDGVTSNVSKRTGIFVRGYKLATAHC